MAVSRYADAVELLRDSGPDNHMVVQHVREAQGIRQVYYREVAKSRVALAQMGIQVKILRYKPQLDGVHMWLESPKPWSVSYKLEKQL